MAKPKTAHLSSNTTLFWRVFLPVFGSVFVTGLVLSFWLISAEELYISMKSAWTGRSLSALAWFGWIFFLRQTLWRLMRVDADPEHIMVTNYWTTVRYKWSDVEAINNGTILWKKVKVIRLKASGRFGQNIHFLPGTYFEPWMEGHVKSFT